MPVEQGLMLRALPPFCPDGDFGVPVPRVVCPCRHVISVRGAGKDWKSIVYGEVTGVAVIPVSRGQRVRHPRAGRARNGADPTRGLVGKGHMLMMETNTNKTASMIMAWLEQASG